MCKRMLSHALPGGSYFFLIISPGRSTVKSQATVRYPCSAVRLRCRRRPARGVRPRRVHGPQPLYGGSLGTGDRGIRWTGVGRDGRHSPHGPGAPDDQACQMPGQIIKKRRDVPSPGSRSLPVYRWDRESTLPPTFLKRKSASCLGIPRGTPLGTSLPSFFV